MLRDKAKDAASESNDYSVFTHLDSFSFFLAFKELIAARDPADGCLSTAWIKSRILSADLKDHNSHYRQDSDGICEQIIRNASCAHIVR